MHTEVFQKDKIILENHDPLLVIQLFQVQMSMIYLKIVIGVANLNHNLQDQKTNGGLLKLLKGHKMSGKGQLSHQQQLLLLIIGGTQVQQKGQIFGLDLLLLGLKLLKPRKISIRKIGLIIIMLNIHQLRMFC